MVASPLVEPYIEEGRNLIDRLLHGGYQMEAAYWLYLAESDSWRLYVATKVVEEHGPIEAFRRLRALMEPDSSLTLLDVAVIGPKRQIPRALVKNVRFGPRDKTKRIHHSYIDGEYIDDALVYRLTA